MFLLWQSARGLPSFICYWETFLRINQGNITNAAKSCTTLQIELLHRDEQSPFSCLPSPGWCVAAFPPGSALLYKCKTFSLCLQQSWQPHLTRNHSYNKDKHRHTAHWAWEEMLSQLQAMLEVQGWTVDLIYFKETCGDYNRGLMGPVHPGVGMGGVKCDQSRGWAVMARNDAANRTKALQAPGGWTPLPVLADLVIPVKMCLLRALQSLCGRANK